MKSYKRGLQEELKMEKIVVYWFLIRLSLNSNPNPLPWILMYNQNAEKQP